MNKGTGTGFQNNKRKNLVRFLLAILFLGFVLIFESVSNSKAQPPPAGYNLFRNTAGSQANAINDRGVYSGYGRDTQGAFRLERAGEMRQEDGYEGEVTLFEFNVKMLQDSTTMWCDLAKYYRDRRQLLLRGNVLIMDPSRSLEASEILYYQDQKRATARNNVEVHRDSVILTCRQGIYEENGGVASFHGEMDIFDENRKIRLTGDRGVWEGERERGQVPENPVLTRLDSLGEAEITIVSNFMVYDAQYGIAEAREEVVFDWQGVHGTCHRMFYFPDERKAKMVGDPVVTRNRDETRGDTIWVYMVEDQLDSVEVYGHAVAFMAMDSTENSLRSRMNARRIVLDFQDGKVSRVQGDQEAEAVYHLFEEEEDKGSNEVSGDTIILYMADGKVESILVSGGTEGTYYPASMAGRVRRDE